MESGGLTRNRPPSTAIERWLREQVAPVYDAMQVDPGRGLSVYQVTAALDTRHAARLKKPRRSS